MEAQIVDSTGWWICCSFIVLPRPKFNLCWSFMHLYLYMVDMVYGVGSCGLIWEKMIS